MADYYVGSKDRIKRVKGTEDIVIPSNISNKELDQYVKERSGEVKTYRLEDLNNEVNNDTRRK